MMSLVMVAALLTGAPEGQDGAIVWRSYNEALEQGGAAKKPLAVFFGAGPEGYRKVVTGGAITTKAVELLASAYVPVFIDTNTAEGKRWVKAFEMNENVGVVISDRTGGYQMLFHEGTIDTATLERQLERLREGEVRLSMYPPASNQFNASRGAAYCPT